MNGLPSGDAVRIMASGAKCDCPNPSQQANHFFVVIYLMALTGTAAALLKDCTVVAAVLYSSMAATMRGSGMQV